MRFWSTVALVAVVVLGTAGGASAKSEVPNSVKKFVVTKSRTVSESCPGHVAGLIFYRSKFVQHMLEMGTVKVDFTRPRNCARAVYLAHRWQSRAYRARVELTNWRAKQRSQSEAQERRQLYEKWRCIHEHEGAWDSNTGNGYYGGLQMDMGFQRTYGSEFMSRWGTADHWPVWAQITAAERAYYGYAGYGGRGFSPWGTRGMCGL